MTAGQFIMLIIAIAVIVGGAALLFMTNRTKKLRMRFGTEYDRAVRKSGSRLKAEAELERLEHRVESYPLRPLSSSEQDRFQQAWRAIQAKFVDDPAGAFLQADRLLTEVMSACGYPMADFEQRAAEISVGHGNAAEHYRIGHEITLRHQQNQATTEELRQGMVHFRALFDEIAGEPRQFRTATTH